MEDQVPGDFSVGMSLAGIEPVGFRVKSDLRNHQAIVKPRALLPFVVASKRTQWQPESRQ